MRIRAITCAILASIAMPSCGSGGTGSSDIQPGDLPNRYDRQSGVNTIQATIDGVAWSGTVGQINRAFYPSFGPASNHLRLGGSSNPALDLILRVDGVTGPGTYPLGGVTSPVLSGTWTGFSLFGYQDGFFTARWVATMGSITVTAIDAVGAKGTFGFTADPDPTSKAIGQLIVTDGQFDVTF